MTRGRICVATDEKLLNSVEFNGDMYVEHGHGEEVIEAFESGITNEQEYREYVKAFDDKNFNYSAETRDSNGENYFDGSVYVKGVRERLLGSEEVENLLDFSHNYIDKWLSDYFYLKNIGTSDLYITCAYGYEDNGIYKEQKDVSVRIAPNQYIVLCFGRIVIENSTCEILTELEDKKEKEFDEYCEFDGYWEMTSNGIVVYDTENDREFDLTEVDDSTIDHIVEEVRDGYTKGDIHGAYKERV